MADIQRFGASHSCEFFFLGLYGIRPGWCSLWIRCALYFQYWPLEGSQSGCVQSVVAELALPLPKGDSRDFHDMVWHHDEHRKL